MSRQELAWMAVPPLSSYAKLSHVRTDMAETRLEDGYKPHPFDVICKRDRESISHVGNNRFRLFVDMRVERYILAETRHEKTAIIQEIIDSVHVSGGRFIRQEDKCTKQDQPREIHCKVYGYFAIGRKKVADKVGHAMRLAVSKREAKSNRRSSWPVRIEAAARNGIQTAFDWEGSYKQVQQGIVLARHVSSEHDYKLNQALARSGLECHDMQVSGETGTVYPDAKLTVTAKYRRQSLHAGGNFDGEKRNEFASTKNWQEDFLFSNRDDMSHTEWGLSNCVPEENDADANSVGTSIDFGALPRSLQVLAGSTMIGTDPVFDNDDLFWDEYVVHT